MINKINNYKFLTLIVMILFCTFLLTGCGKYDVEYINENLSAEGFIVSNYSKTITYSDVLLLEEKTDTIFNGSVYSVTKKIKQLSNDPTNLYTEEETKYDTAIDGNPIGLSIKEADFSEFEINEFNFKGTIKDEAINSLLKINNAKDGFFEVVLNENLKVQSLKIAYVDTTTGYKVSIAINYLY